MSSSTDKPRRTTLGDLLERRKKDGNVVVAEAFAGHPKPSTGQGKWEKLNQSQKQHIIALLYAERDKFRDELDNPLLDDERRQLVEMSLNANQATLDILYGRDDSHDRANPTTQQP